MSGGVWKRPYRYFGLAFGPLFYSWCCVQPLLLLAEGHSCWSAEAGRDGTLAGPFLVARKPSLGPCGTDGARRSWTSPPLGDLMASAGGGPADCSSR